MFYVIESFSLHNLNGQLLLRIITTGAGKGVENWISSIASYPSSDLVVSGSCDGWANKTWMIHSSLICSSLITDSLTLCIAAMYLKTDGFGSGALMWIPK